MRIKSERTLLVLIGLIGWTICGEDPVCDNVYEACYFKTSDEEGAVQRGTTIPISKANFLMGAKIVMEPPAEFKANVYGNPFPLISIFFYAKKGKVMRNFYFKIKNVEKNEISKTRGASLLEGDYEFPYLIITVPFMGSSNEDKRKFVVNSGVVQTLTDYLYSSFRKFPMNAYVDLFKNEVSFDFSSVSVDSLVKRDNSTAFQEDMFRYNLRAYQRACSAIRMESNQTGEVFKKETLDRVEDGEQKTEWKRLKITDFLRTHNFLSKMGSFCSEIKDSIGSDAGCLKSNPNKCESFLRFEKVGGLPSVYQFHLFTRAHVSFVTMSFMHAKNLKTRLEVFCERGKEFLEYILVQDEKRFPVKNLKEMNMNASLIYSTLDDILYCGVRLPFSVPLAIGNTEFNFQLNNQSILELDFGSYASDKTTRIRTWYTQFPLDFNFSNEIDVEWEITTFVLFGLVGGLVILLCMTVSGYIIKKYNSLSRKLTEAGSNISNLSLVSGVASNAGANSSQMSSNRQTGSRSEFITPEEVNSSMASRFGRNIDQNITSMPSGRSGTGRFSTRISSPSAGYRSSGYSNQRPSSATSRSKPSRHYRP